MVKENQLLNLMLEDNNILHNSKGENYFQILKNLQRQVNKK